MENALHFCHFFYPVSICQSIPGVRRLMAFTLKNQYENLTECEDPFLSSKLDFHPFSAVEEKPSSAGSRSSKKDKEADLVEVKSSGYSKKWVRQYNFWKNSRFIKEFGTIKYFGITRVHTFIWLLDDQRLLQQCLILVRGEREWLLGVRERESSQEYPGTGTGIPRKTKLDQVYYLCMTHQMSHKKRNYSVGWTVPYEMMN